MATLEENAKNISVLKAQIKEMGKQVDRHTTQIDKICEDVKDLKIEFTDIKRDVEFISDGIRRVEKTVNKTDERIAAFIDNTNDKITEIKDEGVEKHYVKPLLTYRKIAWLIVGVVITTLVTLLLITLFPHL